MLNHLSNPVRIIVLCLIAGGFFSCKQEKKPQSNFLFRTYHRPFFFQYKPENLRMAIKLRLERPSSAWHRDKKLNKYYADHDFHSYFVDSFLENKGIDSLISYLNKAEDHGLQPSDYQGSRLHTLYTSLNDSLQNPTITDIYVKLSEIELIMSNSLYTYSKDLQYGRIDPSKLYSSRFYLKFKQADTSLYSSMFAIKDMPTYLHSVQPRNYIYQKLKDTLAYIRTHKDQDMGKMPASFYIRQLKLNMERMRWQPLDTSSDFLLVNIPAFSLFAFENNRIVWNMRVCVGEKKQDGYEEKMKIYRKTGNIDDRPQNHQTPLLSSTFESVQLNPRWNVPVSILQNEIYYNVRKNPNYLAEKNYKLYRGDKQVGRIDTINWSKIRRDHIPFTLKQDAGELNALGKLKFTFPNPYSIYLHDTPNKSAFKQSERDVSHGCVRVQDPIRLAEYLTRFNGKNTIDQIRIGIGLKPQDSSERWQKAYDRKQEELSHNGGHLNTSTISLKKKIPIFIQYYTCWLDQQGRVSFLNDIYQLDPAVEAALQKSF